MYLSSDFMKVVFQYFNSCIDFHHHDHHNETISLKEIDLEREPK